MPRGRYVRQRQAETIPIEDDRRFEIGNRKVRLEESGDGDGCWRGHVSCVTRSSHD
jgi:hypothetical protein